MKDRLLKVFGAVCLSVLFAYSGVAWVFADCLQDSEQSKNEQLVSSNSESARPLIIDARPIDKRTGTLHCVATNRAFDVIAQSYTIASLKQLLGGVQFATFPAISSASIGGVGNFGGHPVPGWLVGSSPSRSLARHLLLSIFLI